MIVILFLFAVSSHPAEHYTVTSNGYMPPPAHMFGRAFQESRNSTAGQRAAANHHPTTRSATRLDHRLKFSSDGFLSHSVLEQVAVVGVGHITNIQQCNL